MAVPLVTTMATATLLKIQLCSVRMPLGSLANQKEESALSLLNNQSQLSICNTYISFIFSRYDYTLTKEIWTTLKEILTMKRDVFYCKNVISYLQPKFLTKIRF